ncbi:GNAT family N-acetyltransferase [Streptomyces nojiriensis]|uniref:GNAT family N-acetyltransferase n=1 Tax=Streptomyces nojiriensis TaxID=66374 RepID=UPI0035DA2A00
MTEIHLLTPEILPEFREALEKNSGDGVDGIDHMRMSRITRAMADSSAAFIQVDGEFVGYVANLHDRGNGFELVECVGEVLPAWRRRGFGGQLVDWAIRQAAEKSHSSMLEIVVDALVEDGGLNSLLDVRGFSSSHFTQVSAKVERCGTEEPGPTEIRSIRAQDASSIADLSARISKTEPLARGGEISILSTLRHPYLRRDRCLIALGPDGRAAGVALTLVWPNDTEDLWIETLCAEPSDAKLLRRMVAEIIGSAADEFRTVSMGASDALLKELGGMGFIEEHMWTRNSLLVMAG